MSVYVSLLKELFLYPPQGVSLKSGCKSNNFYPNMQDFYTTFFNFYSIFLKELIKVKGGHGRTHYYIREAAGDNTGERERGGGRGRRIMTEARGGDMKGGCMLKQRTGGNIIGSEIQSDVKLIEILCLILT